MKISQLRNIRSRFAYDFGISVLLHDEAQHGFKGMCFGLANKAAFFGMVHKVSQE